MPLSRPPSRLAPGRAALANMGVAEFLMHATRGFVRPPTKLGLAGFGRRGGRRGRLGQPWCCPPALSTRPRSSVPHTSRQHQKMQLGPWPSLAPQSLPLWGGARAPQGQSAQLAQRAPSLDLLAAGKRKRSGDFGRIVVWCGIERTVWKSQRSDCCSGTGGRGIGTVHMLRVATFKGNRVPKF